MITLTFREISRNQNDDFLQRHFLTICGSREGALILLSEAEYAQLEKANQSLTKLQADYEELRKAAAILQDELKKATKSK